MAKVGIVTFHNAHNYGAVLQCFALQEALRGLGFNAEVINYYNVIFTRGYTDGIPKFGKSSLKELIRDLLLFPIKGSRKKKRYNGFSNFIFNNLNLSPTVNKKNKFDFEKYDAIIFGSDQIWNKSLTDNDTFFFGDFPYSGSKISYAASAGKGYKNISNYIRMLKEFDNIGVRELDLKDELISLGFSNVVTNIDPTLLLTADEWKSKLSIIDKPVDDYVLVYPLRERTGTVKMAQEFAKRNDLELVEIGAQILYRKHKNRIETLSPKDFIRLFANAKYVVTNSFHGTVFSIIFNRRFNTVALNDGEDNRAQNLLSNLSIDNNMIQLGESVNFKDIDYDKVNNQLDILREQSKQFLLYSINNPGADSNYEIAL